VVNDLAPKFRDDASLGVKAASGKMLFTLILFNNFTSSNLAAAMFFKIVIVKTVFV